MSRDTELAANYFAPPRLPLWTWADGGEAISWHDGATALFSAELLPVLKRLSGDGLPPFTGLVYLLGACRHRWPESAGRALLAQFARSHTALADVLRGFDSVHQARETVEGNLPELAAMIFEECGETTSTAEGAILVRALEDGLDPLPPPPSPPPLGPEADRALAELREALLPLRRTLSAWNRAAWERRRQTGLADLPAPPDWDESPAEAARRLIAELSDEPQFAGLAGLARDLMAAATLPRPLDEPEHLPQGGYSDLTNRGPLDRLLASELAHDDNQLSLRVALGEALYLRREAPPRVPARHRLLLCDTGLRTWGAPRVLLAAAALALAATSHGERAELHYPGEGRLERLTLRTPADLLELLSTLQPHADLRGALQEFHHQVREREGCEAIVLGTDDLFAAPHFSPALRETGRFPWYLAEVSRAGCFRLWEENKWGRKLLRRAEFNLDRVLPPEPSGESLLRDRSSTRLPALFRAPVVNLLFSLPLALSNSWSASPVLKSGEQQEAFSYSPEGALYHWFRRGKGARLLSRDLPRGALVWGEQREAVGDHEPTHAVVSDPRGMHLLTIDPAGRRVACRSLPLPADAAGSITFFTVAGVLLAIERGCARAFELAGGGEAGRLELKPDLEHVHGRFFRERHGAWWCLGHDGLQPQLQLLHDPRGDRPELIAMGETRRGRGPLGLTADFAFHDPAESRVYGRRTVRRRFGPRATLRYSRDGCRMLIREGTNAILVDFALATFHACSENAPPEMRLERLFRPRGVLRDVISCALGEQELFLRTKGGQFLRLFAASPEIGLANERRGLNFDWRSLTLLPGAETPGCRLRAVTLPNGLRVVHDSRGLLHLASADPEPLEMSLVLNQPRAAAWIGDGRLGGDPFFLDGPPVHGPEPLSATFLRLLEPS